MDSPHLFFLTFNKSETVFQLFEKAIHEYGVPDRIRTDKVENIKVIPISTHSHNNSAIYK